jgi:hypothetical protein
MNFFLPLPAPATKPALTVRIGLLASVCLIAFACSRKSQPREAQNDSAASTPKQTTESEKQEPESSTPTSPPKPQAPPPTATSPDPSSPQSAVPARPKPTGKPSPNARSGHAVAFAGWKPSKDGSRDVVLLCDPGDNAIEGRSLHGWDAKPRELPVYFGTRRPSIVLLPAGAFTVTGAVVVTATDSDKTASTQPEPATAAGMPDLSQDLNPAWIGLCGSTSGANILFYMGQQNPKVLRGFLRGPSNEADAGVVKLIVGSLECIHPDSLAGQMGTSEDGSGATNLGMRAGMESWLSANDEGRWSANLDWFNDQERSREQQREFFSRLAASVRGGGGAILCLWPGTEYSDSAIGEDESTAAVADRGDSKDTSATAPAPTKPAASPSADNAQQSPLPNAAFPALPPSPPESRPTLPGRPPSGLTEREKIEQAAKQLASARARLESNEPAKAFDHVTKAITLLQQHGGDSAEAAELLADAMALSKEIERRLPTPSGKALQKRTVFQ